MFLVLIIWFQPIKHVLACWSSPFSCYKILFWWSGNWHRLETPFLLQWWLEVWTNYMIQDYWIHVPNHQWLFTFPTLLMTQWKIHIYIYICLLHRVSVIEVVGYFKPQWGKHDNKYCTQELRSTKFGIPSIQKVFVMTMVYGTGFTTLFIIGFAMICHNHHHGFIPIISIMNHVDWWHPPAEIL